MPDSLNHQRYLIPRLGPDGVLFADPQESWNFLKSMPAPNQREEPVLERALCRLRDGLMSPLEAIRHLCMELNWTDARARAEVSAFLLD